MEMDYRNRLHQTIQHCVWLYQISQTHITTYLTKQNYGSDTLYHTCNPISYRPKIFTTNHLPSCPTISHPRRLSYYKRTHDNIIDIGMHIQDGKISPTLFYSNKNIVDCTDSTAHDILFVIGQRCAPYHKKLLGYKDTTAVLTHNKLLTLTDISLALWWDTVEATTTSIAGNSYYCKTIANITTNTVVCCK